ncbi:MAG: hypothetical protein K6G15_11260 [Desulfovibrio sp.]|nr:hypothetical protein [Desulfovibrio sp.]
MATSTGQMEGVRTWRQGLAANSRHESQKSWGRFSGLRRVLSKWFFSGNDESEKPVEFLDRTAENLNRIAAMNEENMHKMLLSQERIAIFQKEAEHKQQMRTGTGVIWHDIPRGRCMRSEEENADFAEAILACEISNWEDLQERELALNRQEDTCVTDLHALRVDIAPGAEKRSDYLALLA